jgi:hypothetical protein
VRWFKHITDSHEDEKLAQVISKHGLEGYGFWWLLLEIIGKQTGKDDDKCSVTYPMTVWLRISGFYHHKKFRDLVVTLHDLSLIYAQCPSNVPLIYELSINNVLTISIPNLLKYRDEYSKKSRQTSDSVRTKIEIEKQKKKVFVPPTAEMVKTYMEEIGYKGDPQSFVDSNTAKGWVIGKLKTPAKDWKAMVRTWHGNDKKKNIDTPALIIDRDAYTPDPKLKARLAQYAN